MSGGGPKVFYRPRQAKPVPGAPVALGRRIAVSGRDWAAQFIDVHWTEAFRAALLRVIALLEASSEPRRQIPRARLTARLEFLLSDPINLHFELGMGPRELRAPQPRPVAVLPGRLDPEEAAREITDVFTRAMSIWLSIDLKPLLDRLNGQSVHADIEALVLQRRALAITPRSGEILSPDGVVTDFPALAHLLARQLQGQELFPGYGACRRVIRAAADRNYIELMAPPAPVTLPRGATVHFSPMAVLSIETFPFCGGPILKLVPRKRLWAQRVRRGVGMRGVTGYLLTGDGPDDNPGLRDRAYSFRLPFGSQGLELGEEAEVMAYESGMRSLTQASDILQLRFQRESRDAWMGVNYSTAFGSHALGDMMLEWDEQDLLQRADALLADFIKPGQPLLSRPVKVSKRSDTGRKMLSVEAFLASVHSDQTVSDEAWDALVRQQGIQEEEAERLADDGKTAAQLTAVREINEEALRVVHGGQRPEVWVIADDASVVEQIVSGLQGVYGAGVDYKRLPLPSGVHGLREDLPSKDEKAPERFKARVEKWKRYIEERMPVSTVPRYALVCVADEKNDRHEDQVNYYATLRALSVYGKCNTHFVLPVGSGTVEHFFHRLQSSANDLLLAHNCYQHDLSGFITDVFEKSVAPRYVYGVNVVRMEGARRSGQRAASLVTATRLEVATGKAELRIGYAAASGGARTDTGWMLFRDGLRHVAGLHEVTLGNAAEAQSLFQDVVKAVLREAVSGDDQPLVMFDSLSSQGLWPWLADSRITGKRLDLANADLSQALARCRIVRIRRGASVPLRVPMSREWDELRAGDEGGLARLRPSGVTVRQTYLTTALRLVELSREVGSGAVHYLGVSGYTGKSKIVRGCSGVRATENYREAEDVITKEPITYADPATGEELVAFERLVREPLFRDQVPIPASIDVTVVKTAPGDDPDEIARAVMGLRAGHAQTNDWTTLPAPLFYQAKVRDNFVGFALANMAVDDEPGVPAPRAAPVETAEPIDERMAPVAVDDTAASAASTPVSTRLGTDLQPTPSTPAPTPPSSGTGTTNGDWREKGWAIPIVSYNLILAVLKSGVRVSLPSFVSGNAETLAKMTTRITPSDIRHIWQNSRNWEGLALANRPESKPNKAQFHEFVLANLDRPFFVSFLNSQFASEKHDRYVGEELWKPGIHTALNGLIADGVRKRGDNDQLLDAMADYCSEDELCDCFAISCLDAKPQTADRALRALKDTEDKRYEECEIYARALTATVQRIRGERDRARAATTAVIPSPSPQAPAAAVAPIPSTADAPPPRAAEEETMTKNTKIVVGQAPDAWDDALAAIRTALDGMTIDSTEAPDRLDRIVESAESARTAHKAHLAAAAAPQRELAKVMEQLSKHLGDGGLQAWDPDLAVLVSARCKALTGDASDRGVEKAKKLLDLLSKALSVAGATLKQQEQLAGARAIADRKRLMVDIASAHAVENSVRDELLALLESGQTAERSNAVAVTETAQDATPAVAASNTAEVPATVQPTVAPTRPQATTSVPQGPLGAASELPPTPTIEPDDSSDASGLLDQSGPSLGEVLAKAADFVVAGRPVLAVELAACYQAAHPTEPGLEAPVLRALSMAIAQTKVDGLQREEIEERLQPFVEQPPEWGDGPGQTTAVLAALGAALRPALYMPSSTGRYLLESLRMFGPALPLHNLAELFRSEINAGVQLSPDLFRGSAAGGREAWEASFARLRTRANDWGNEKALVRKFTYHDAFQVWELLQKRTSPVGAALQSVAREQKDAMRGAVERALTYLKNGNDSVITEVLADYRKRQGIGHRRSIQFLAREQLERNLNHTRQFLNEVQDALNHDPARLKSSSVTDKIAEKLRPLLKGASDWLARWSQTDPLQRAAAVACRMAIDDVLQDFDPKASSKPAITLRAWEGRELLWLPVSYDGRWGVQTSDRPAMLAALMREPVNGHPGLDWVPEAYEEHVEVDRLLPAARLEALHPARQHLRFKDKVVEKARKELRNSVEAARREVSAAITMSVINDARKADLESKIEQVEEVIGHLPCGLEEGDPPPPAAGTSLYDFPAARQIIEQGVRQTLGGDFAAARSLFLKKLDAARADIREDLHCELDRVRQMALGGNSAELQTAEEMLEMLRAGTTLPTRLHRNESLAEFNAFLDRVVKGQTTGLVDSALQALRDESSDTFPEVAKLTSAQRLDGQTLLQAFKNIVRGSSKHSDRDKTGIRPFLETMGVNVRVLRTPSGGDTQFELETESLTNLPFFVPPMLGSAANGHYKVDWTATKPTVENLRQLMSRCTKPTFSFVPSVVDPDSRKQLVHESRQHESSHLILVDAALAVHIALSGDGRLQRLLHCTAPLLTINPYEDNSDLKPEMFYGRKATINRIRNLNVGAVMFGGRRLGKTSVLRYLMNRVTDRKEGVFYVRVSMQDIREEYVTVLWHKIGTEVARAIPDLKQVEGKDAADIRRQIVRWLDADGRRRLCVMVDEADAFLEADAEKKLETVSALVELANQTNSRFRTLFVGLHNVQRMITVQNSALRQLSDPVRLEPYVGDDRKEGVKLVQEPMAALGFEFESADLPLQILSITNFYPALVQLFCRALLTRVQKRGLDRAPPYTIRAEDVRATTEDDSLRKELTDRFRNTLRLDDRYELIALLLALKKYERAGELPAESLDAIRKNCLTYAPKFFEGSVDTVDTLLDEMVGLGVLSRERDRYWLRAPTVATMLGAREAIESDLLEFLNREPKKHTSYSARRRIPEGKHDCLPISQGQFQRLFRNPDFPVAAVVGSRASRIETLLSLKDDSYMRELQLDVSVPPRAAIAGAGTIADEVFRRKLSVTGPSKVWIIGPDVRWDAQWVRRLVGARDHLKASKARVVFVGGADHAIALANDRELLPSITVESAAPWHASAVTFYLQDLEAPPAMTDRAVVDKVLAHTGGMSEWIQRACQRLAMPGADVDKTLAELGVPRTVAEVLELFNVPAAFADVLVELESARPDAQAATQILAKGSLPIQGPAALSYLTWMGAVVVASDGSYMPNELILDRMTSITTT